MNTYEKTANSIYCDRMNLGETVYRDPGRFIMALRASMPEVDDITFAQNLIIALGKHWGATVVTVKGKQLHALVADFLRQTYAPKSTIAEAETLSEIDNTNFEAVLSPRGVKNILSIEESLFESGYIKHDRTWDRGSTSAACALLKMEEKKYFHHKAPMHKRRSAFMDRYNVDIRDSIKPIRKERREPHMPGIADLFQ